MKKILIFILMLFLTTTAFGQETNLINKDDLKKEIYTLLHSKETKDRAWAAYYIGRYEMAEMVPELYELLNSYSLKSDPNNSYVQYVVLDTLIQLDASLPKDKVESVYKNFPRQTLILLAKNPQESRQNLFSALELEQETNSLIWVAICNLLINMRPPELATKLLGEVKPIAYLSLYDKGSVKTGVTGYVINPAKESWFSIPAGFPPTAYYTLTMYPKFGDVVLAWGQATIYYKKQIVKGGENIRISEQPPIERNTYTIKYLAQLLDTNYDTITSYLSNRSKLNSLRIKDYSKKIDKARIEMEDSYTLLVKLFEEKNLLTSSAVLSVKDRTEIIVHDFRRNKTPLPQLPGIKIENF